MDFYTILFECCFIFRNLLKLVKVRVFLLYLKVNDLIVFLFFLFMIYFFLGVISVFLMVLFYGFYIRDFIRAFLFYLYFRVNLYVYF